MLPTAEALKHGVETRVSNSGRNKSHPIDKTEISEMLDFLFLFLFHILLIKIFKKSISADKRIGPHRKNRNIRYVAKFRPKL